MGYTGLCWTVLGCSELNLALMDRTGLHWAVLDCTGLYLAVLEYTGLDCLHWDLIGGVVTGHWALVRLFRWSSDPGDPGGRGGRGGSGGPDDQHRLYAFRKYMVFMV